MRGRTFEARAAWAALAVAAATVIAPAGAQASTGWTAKQVEQRITQFGKLTSQHFDQTTEVKDDSLEVVATIDTSRGHTFKGAFTDTVRADTFLRALIDKKTGKTIFQVYARLTYSLERRNFHSAIYATTGGPISEPLLRIHSDVDCKYGCVFTDDVAFPVPETWLRELAVCSDERPVRPWRFRFKAQAGLDWTDDMAPAEAAGLLMAVDQYKAARKLP